MHIVRAVVFLGGVWMFVSLGTSDQILFHLHNWS